MIDDILRIYGIDPQESQVQSLTSGLINSTWKVSWKEKDFIVQRINNQVFKKPFEVAENIRMIDEYLKQHYPAYLFVSPVQNLKGGDIYFDETRGYFRIFPFIKGSHTINVVSNPEQAFEAAFQFGKFTRLLSGFNAARLNITIPDFHNLTLRYAQFQTALKNGDPGRIRESSQWIAEINKYVGIVDSFEKLRRNAQVKFRVTHHDTKISNVLFDDEDRGLCVIDLDTVMPGYFISDVGDMMRTYLSPANEEDQDFDKIEIREDYFRAIVNGYLSNMGDELTPDERELILYSGLFLIFMQAIRFLADYFNRDVYYGARYEKQNLVRGGNQVVLLKRLDEKREILEKIIVSELQSKKHFIV
ncbi:MAG TPA: aminoglycoside phosphotransferase family protein [Chryseosolibacter sp.]